jgi:IS1 family transposase
MSVLQTDQTVEVREYWKDNYRCFAVLLDGVYKAIVKVYSVTNTKYLVEQIEKEVRLL